MCEKTRGINPSKSYIQDELSFILEKYTKEQIKEILESIKPKTNSKTLKIPIIYGTG